MGRSASACQARRLASASFKRAVHANLSSFVSDDSQCLKHQENADTDNYTMSKKSNTINTV